MMSLRVAWGTASIAVLVLAAAAWATPSPIVFEDDSPRAPPPPPPPPQPQGGDRRGDHRGISQPYGSTARGFYPTAPASGSQQPGDPPPVDSEGRLLFQKKRKKKKKVICGLAGLIAGRDAGQGRSGAEHRAARAVDPQQSGQGGQGDTRSYGGVGVAGFLLGTLVGSKLGYGYGAHYPPQQQHPQPLPAAPAPTQTQTQTQVQGVAVPVVPVVPLVPAPVHEDYDEVEDDPLGGGGGGGGGSLCDQLQQRPEPGPLDSHFPLIHGLLLGGGQQPQRPLYRPPPQQYYRPPPQYYSKPNFLYNYVKPWADLFFK